MKSDDIVQEVETIFVEADSGTTKADPVLGVVESLRDLTDELPEGFTLGEWLLDD